MIFSQENSANIYLFCILWLCSCAGVPRNVQDVPKPMTYLASTNHEIIYNADFQYKDFNASGLLVMKRLQAFDYHVALMSKFGANLLEFKLSENRITWIKIPDQLNTNVVRNIIERDFRVLMLMNLDAPQNVKLKKSEEALQTFKATGNSIIRLKYNAEDSTFVQAENRKLINLSKTKVRFAYQHSGSTIPDRIHLKHRNVDMELTLNRLKN